MSSLLTFDRQNCKYRLMLKKLHRFKYLGMKENTGIPTDSETNIKKIEEKEMIKDIGTYTVYAIGVAIDSIGIIYGKLPIFPQRQCDPYSQLNTTDGCSFPS